MLNIHKRPLKIGITCYPSLGGSGVIASELGKLLSEAGHEVHFITSSVPFRFGKYYPNIFFHEVEVNHYSVFQYPPYDLTLASRMAQVANREKLDILHVHYAVPHAICAYLAKQMIDHPIKVITTLHGTDITVLGYDETLKDMIKLGIEKSDAVTAVSEDLIIQTKDVLQIERPIHKVYNFVDKRIYFKRENGDIRERFAARDEKLIVHISNYRPVKRVMDVAHIFQKINEEVNAKMVFIGEGPDFPKICTWMRENGLEDRVICLGKQEDTSEILSHMDLMLLPSEKESFGLVALEAMSCGVPVVSSNTGGLPEVIEHGKSGYTFPVGDIENMAEAAISLLQDETKFELFSKAAIHRSQTLFDAHKIVKIYEELYYDVLEN
jgi:N-acetyl-alpha-D-glucosaminyl L-malate synthase BshA